MRDDIVCLIDGPQTTVHELSALSNAMPVWAWETIERRAAVNEIRQTGDLTLYTYRIGAATPEEVAGELAMILDHHPAAKKLVFKEFNDVAINSWLTLGFLLEADETWIIPPGFLYES